MRALVLLVSFALAAGGCSALDDFNGFSFGPGGSDLGTTADASGRDLSPSHPGGDLSITPPGCAFPGQRVCIDNFTSGTCGLNPVPDRACPPTSTCQDGYCRPPVGAQSCQSNNDCDIGFDCDLYVGAGGDTLQGFCTSDGGGSGDVGTQCTGPGDDPTCNSGLCAVDSFNMNVIECFFPCGGGGDCPFGGECRNIAEPLTLEGVSTVAVQGCFN